MLISNKANDKAKETELKFFMERNMKHMPEPTYYFSVGDRVDIGNLEDAVVSDVISDKIYEIAYSPKRKGYGKNASDRKCRMLVSWHEIRPHKQTQNKSLVRNKDIKLHYLQQDISSLINKVYSFGINFNPEYQRDFVWDLKDKNALIDSIFNNIDIGKIALIHLEDYCGDYLYEILDGKQRIKTILDFYENKFSYEGFHYNDLCNADKNHFERFTLSVAEVKKCDTLQTMRYFTILNKSGRVMNKDQIKLVEEMIKSLEMNEKNYHCS